MQARLLLLVLTSNQEFGRDIETSFLIPKKRHPETELITIKIMEVDESIVDLDSHTNNMSKSRAGICIVAAIQDESSCD